LELPARAAPKGGGRDKRIEGELGALRTQVHGGGLHTCLGQHGIQVGVQRLEVDEVTGLQRVNQMFR